MKIPAWPAQLTGVRYNISIYIKNVTIELDNLKGQSPARPARLSGFPCLLRSRWSTLKGIVFHRGSV